ncbi:MAG: NAD(P)/FAD-dependent oxidoreductase [Candidatus Krumholzibacteria bacterium]|nr:NAD(P)/FAD-dependent oxidoreductase [Candidatus Krumholzibacteria bacterium]
MKAERYDVAIIGGGPAGSRTAALVAAAGHSVLVLEKREQIGYPVRCAEAVGPRKDVERFLHLDETLVSSAVNGVLMVTPDGTEFQSEMQGIGFIINRELFDRRLAEAASLAGAEIRTGHQAVGLRRENGRIAGVKVKDIGTGSEYEVRTSILVGADGIEALSPRWAGLGTSFRPGEIFSCAQELIDGIDILSTRIEFHLGSRFAPGGYAWVFPKGNGKANVGVGINPLRAKGKSALDHLNEFIAHRCPGGARQRLVIGGCEVARGLPSLATDGYITVGEAARQNNPFSGGGTINALEGADMAAPAIVNSLQDGNTSAKSLAVYTKRWKRSVGRTNRAFYHAASVFFGLNDDEMNRIMKELARVPGIFDEKGIKPARMILELVAAHPALIFKFLRSLTGSRMRR